MKVFKFEIKKLWRQKKFLWLFFIVFIFVAGVYFQNYNGQEVMSERALEKIEPYIEETDILEQRLRAKEYHNEINESEAKQLEYVEGMALAFFHWKSAIYNKEWDQIPVFEHDYLSNLQQFELHGGEFGSLQGIDREKAIQKNKWLITNILPYEDEVNPISPHLLLKENATFLFSALGILILLLFFGNSVTTEKENRTWLTLNTQPVPKWKLIVSKYGSLLLVVVFFLIVVVGISIMLPLIIGDSALSLKYPQIVTTGDTFTIISTFYYVVRVGILFVCANAVAFSLMLFISKWMNNTFSAFMVTGFVLIVGYIFTDMIGILQSPWNPFQFFRFNSIIEGVPSNTDWLYPCSATLWSSLFVSLAILLPEKEEGFLHPNDIGKPFRDNENKPDSVLRSIITFEWRKTKRKGLLKQAIIFVLLLVVVGYTFISQEAEHKEKAYIEKLNQTVKELKEVEIPDYEELLDSHKIMAKEDELYHHFVKDVEDVLELVHEQLRLAKNAIVAYEQGDWVTFYEYQLFENRQLNGEFETGTGSLGGSLAHFVGQLTMDASITEKNWLIERNVQPVFSGEYVKTIYLNWGEEQVFGKEWEDENEKVDNSGLYSLYHYFDLYVYFILIILFLFLLGGGFATEKGKKPTLQFLRTQPISQRKLFLGKISHGLLVSVLSSVGIFLFVILVGTVFDRFGDWDYPILHYDHKAIVEAANYTGMKPVGWTTGFHFTPLGETLINSVLVLLCVLAFLIVLSQVLGIMFKNQFSVYAITIIIVICGYVLSNDLLSSIAHWLPFIFFDIARVTNGELSIVLDNPNINVLNGTMTLVVSTLVLLLLGYLSLIRKGNSHKVKREEV